MRQAIGPQPWGLGSLGQGEYRCRVIGAGKGSGNLMGWEKASQENDVSAVTVTRTVLKGGDAIGAGLTGPPRAPKGPQHEQLQGDRGERRGGDG